MHEEEVMKTITKAVLGLTLGATALTAAAPAEAQRYRYRDRNNAGTAIIAGAAGLAIGAAIAGSQRDRYYDRRYRGYNRWDRDRRYYRHRGYYPRQGFYRDRYRHGWRGCSVRRVYDPYIGRRVNVRYCR
jgi:hypothetical protein